MPVLTRYLHKGFSFRQKMITSNAVDTIEAQHRDVFLWDDQLAGFVVRVMPTGAKDVSLGDEP